ncbi:MAG: ABC transporter permease [archaeon]|nr:ABC transporter permease [archaeon]MCP8315102.1 ABC transporter permease [archaeon]MCP8319387.1 ABC transporter permease [archaeon]
MASRYKTLLGIKTRLSSTKKGLRTKYKTLLSGILFLSIFLLIWQITAMFYPITFLRDASPIKVVSTLVELAVKGDVEGISLLDHTIASVTRVLAGFLVACLSAIPLGLLMGLRKEVYESSKSVIEPIRFIPPIAWIPLAILLLTGFSRYIFLIWLGAFFPILVNTVAGIKRVNPVLGEVAKSFGANKRQIVSKVIVPGSLPEVVAGMRVGLGVGWMCIVAAEMVGAEVTGIGRLILKGAQLLQVDVVIAGMTVIGFIGLFMNEIILLFERRTFKWRREIKV